jgi:hypothetical protein
VFVDESWDFASTPQTHMDPEPGPDEELTAPVDARYVICGRGICDHEELGLPFASAKSREIEGERTLWYYYLLFCEVEDETRTPKSRLLLHNRQCSKSPKKNRDCMTIAGDQVCIDAALLHLI